jgi:hypothetical protein
MNYDGSVPFDEIGAVMRGRLGEIIALERRGIDLAARRLTVERSDWLGHVTVPKGGRSRQLPMTARLTAGLKAARHKCVMGNGWSRGQIGGPQPSIPTDVTIPTALYVVAACGGASAQDPIDASFHLLGSPKTLMTDADSNAAQWDAPMFRAPMNGASFYRCYEIVQLARKADTTHPLRGLSTPQLPESRDYCRRKRASTVDPCRQLSAMSVPPQ